MPEFVYTARNLKGERITGEMSAGTEREVVAALSSRELFPIEVAAQKDASAIRIRRKPNDQAMTNFYTQLSTLLTNGVPMLKSLGILKQQTTSPVLSEVISDLQTRIEDGTSIGDAFARHPKVFNDIAVNMAKAGGEGGFLEDALARVGFFTEQQSELKGRTVGALVYPMVLFVVGTIIVTVLLVYFVPLFADMFDTMKRQGNLPQPTIILIAFSEFLQKWGIWFAGFCTILYFVFRVQLRTDKGRVFADRLKLKIPLFGNIFESLAVARFCRVLGTLLGNGVSILKALEISRHATGNKVLSDTIETATENITAGESLAVPLAKSGQFPPTVTEMISVAEESNTLDTVLVNIADGLESRTSRRLDLMVRLLEPLMLMVMATIILCIVIALLMPIMKMGTTMT